MSTIQWDDFAKVTLVAGTIVKMLAVPDKVC